MGDFLLYGCFIRVGDGVWGQDMTCINNLKSTFKTGLRYMCIHPCVCVYLLVLSTSCVCVCVRERACVKERERERERERESIPHFMVSF